MNLRKLVERGTFLTGLIGSIAVVVGAVLMATFSGYYEELIPFFYGIRLDRLAVRILVVGTTAAVLGGGGWFAVISHWPTAPRRIF